MKETMTTAFARDDFIPKNTGAKITLHRMTRGQRGRTQTLQAGPDLRYHSLDRSTRLHTHEFAEIALVLTGTIRHHVNQETQDLNAGDILFIRPNDIHAYGVPKDSSCEIVNMAFRLEFMLALSRYLEDDTFMKQYTAPVMPPLFHLSSADAEALAHRLMRLNTTQDTARDTTRLKVRVLLAELFTRFFLDGPAMRESEAMPDWLIRCTEAMRNETTLCEGLNALKAMAPCTPEHLCKAFRRYLDRTPTEYINEMRIRHAAKRLVETKDKVLAISLDLGFKSLSRFYHLFTQHYGVPPSKYRAMAARNDIPL